MYHEFDEVRRIHQPYIDNFQRSKSINNHTRFLCLTKLVCNF